MARQKRVPHKPDAFQKRAGAVATWLLERGTIISIGIGAAVVAIIVGALVSRSSAQADENAWTAYYKAAGEKDKEKKLEQVLEEHPTSSARPFVLMALASARLEAPVDDDGKPREEADEERAARLRTVEEPLRELSQDYPDHYLNLYALMLLGELLEERGEYSEAVDVFQNALGAEPGTLEPKLRYDIARNLYLDGRTDEARQPLLLAVELSSKVIYVPERYGQRPRPTKPVWRENAEYLLAKIGRGERAPAPEKKPEEATGEAPAEKTDDAAAGAAEEPVAEKPAAEKPAEQTPAEEKKAEEQPAAANPEEGDAPVAPAENATPEGEAAPTEEKPGT